MKKFILFLFLLTSISLSKVYAQDLGDEFTDPSLEQNASTTSPPQGFDTSAEQTPTPVDEAVSAQTQEDLVPSQILPLPEEESHGRPLALEGPEIDGNKTGDVIIEQQTNLYQSYKQRRGHHGVLFSVNYEKFYPTDYYSMYRDKYIEEFLGSSERLDLLGLEIGYKYNFKLGSIAILGNYAHGSKANSNYKDDGGGLRERNLAVSRYGLSLNYAIDNIMEEPWIVPYGQVGIHQFQVVEDDLSKSEAEEITTQIAFNYKIGLLFQLNWIEKAIDPNTQVDGLKSSGLQNTFIDVFAMTHMSSSEVYDPKNSASEGDPDLGTGMEFGVGLKIEF